MDCSVEIRVQGRDKKAAALYRYMHWFTRFHRRPLDDLAARAIIDQILYGPGTLRQNIQRAVPILRPSRER